MFELLLLYLIPPLLALSRMVLFLIGRDDRYPTWLKVISDLLLMFACPAFILFTSAAEPQDCCNRDGLNIFAKDHVLTMICWWFLGLAAYGYVQYRSRISTPVVEVVTAWILMFSIFFNVLIIVQERDFSWIFCLPIILLLLTTLARQHRQLVPRLRKIAKPDMLDATAFREEVPTQEKLADGTWQARLRPLLDWPIVAKYPVILVLGAPVFLVVDTILLLFGQRPDSFYSAFTETYYYRLSELDYLCEGVQCGGHYLCSVAAGGHPEVVRPVRMGVRRGKPIICNRQLLVANAFEEVIEEYWPAGHRFIRRHYDRVGDFIHKDYTRYKNKYLCDLIYLLMKPADWLFRIVLYTVDREPEKRIGRQYR